MRITLTDLGMVGELVDVVRSLFGKRPKAKKVLAALGGSEEHVSAYLSGCEKLEEARRAGVGLGTLTAPEVAAIAKSDDVLVKAARRVERWLKANAPKALP